MLVARRTIRRAGRGRAVRRATIALLDCLALRASVVTAPAPAAARPVSPRELSADASRGLRAPARAMPPIARPTCRRVADSTESATAPAPVGTIPPGPFAEVALATATPSSVSLPATEPVH